MIASGTSRSFASAVTQTARSINAPTTSRTGKPGVPPTRPQHARTVWHRRCAIEAQEAHLLGKATFVTAGACPSRLHARWCRWDKWTCSPPRPAHMEGETRCVCS
jgi:hypothetical protein